MMDLRHVLILGGTSEARRLCENLARQPGLSVTLSLAGRTAQPLAHVACVRRGGFGGAEGLATYLRDHRIDILVDATHPFATRISENGRRATRETKVPLVALERPPWTPIEGDRWIDVTSLTEAAARLGLQPRRVFLAVGRQELGPFAAQHQHSFVVRSVDPVEPSGALIHARFILERGPFDETAERRLLIDNEIDIIVAKNSGGTATYGKIIAARALGLPVIMVARPRACDADALSTVEEAVEQIHHLVALDSERGE